jgi:hypothetical protein
MKEQVIPTKNYTVIKEVQNSIFPTLEDILLQLPNLI